MANIMCVCNVLPASHPGTPQYETRCSRQCLNIQSYLRLRKKVGYEESQDECPEILRFGENQIFNESNLFVSSA